MHLNQTEYRNKVYPRLRAFLFRWDVGRYLTAIAICAVGIVLIVARMAFSYSAQMVPSKGPISGALREATLWIDAGKDPRNIPRDVCSPTFDFMQVDWEHQAIWSIGPDQKNNHGRITYDPTNGSTSAGDIVIRFDGRLVR